MPLILNTRPKKQAQALSNLLRESHFRVNELPLIEIKAVSTVKKTVQHQVNHYDLLIFISVNAVVYYFKGFDLPASALPQQTKIAVIGKSTAEVFFQYSGKKADIIPATGSDSEALLGHKELQQIKKHSILIVRGVGGREYLAQQLQHRGAKVDYLEVYQRICPHYEQKYITELWQKEPIGFMVISSVESFLNLLQLSQSLIKTQILNTNIIVIHHKIKEKLKKLGVNGKIIVSKTSSNIAMVETLRLFYKNS